MDSRISMASRPDVVLVESTARPTPTPVRVSFSQVLAAGASGLVKGAELASTHLPGAPVAAAAIRTGSTFMSRPVGGLALPAPGVVPEGPGTPSSSMGLPSVGASLAAGSAPDSTGGIDASLQQSAQLSMYYLQVQQEVDAQNRSFTALSNVLKTQHDSAKAAIQNIHS